MTPCLVRVTHCFVLRVTPCLVLRVTPCLVLRVTPFLVPRVTPCLSLTSHYYGRPRLGCRSGICEEGPPPPICTTCRSVMSSHCTGQRRGWGGHAGVLLINNAFVSSKLLFINAREDVEEFNLSSKQFRGSKARRVSIKPGAIYPPPPPLQLHTLCYQ